MIDDCGEAFPLIAADLIQSLISQAACDDRRVEKKIFPRFEHDTTLDRARWQNEVLTPTRCCSKTDNYA